jgi:Zn-dependent protease with chaperone function
MIALRLLFYLTPLALAGAVSGADQPVSIVSSRQIALAAPAGASHSLSLSLYMFRDTRWSQDDIEAAVVGSARLLSQCAVGIELADLHVVEAPPRFRVYSTRVSRALLRALKVRKPAVFFVEETRNDPPYDAEAIGRGNSASRPELTDTVWIAHGARDLPQVLAHELVHVLSDSGAHSDEPGNLMAEDTSAQNTQLSAAQCERARARGEANDLLAPRPKSRRLDRFP